MKVEVTKIDSKKTALIFSLCIAIFSILFLMLGICLLVYSLITENRSFLITSISYIIFPIVYSLLAYLFTRFSCWIYNRLAKRINGVTIELVEIKNDSADI